MSGRPTTMRTKLSRVFQNSAREVPEHEECEISKSTLRSPLAARGASEWRKWCGMTMRSVSAH